MSELTVIFGTNTHANTRKQTLLGTRALTYSNRSVGAQDRPYKINPVSTFCIISVTREEMLKGGIGSMKG